MICYPDSLKELAAKLVQAIDDRFDIVANRLDKLEEKDENRKELLRRFLEMTDNLKADKDRIKKIDAFFEATKEPEIKAFSPEGEPGPPSKIERRDEFIKQEVNFMDSVDEMIAEEQIELHGTRNVLEGRDSLVSDDGDDVPMCCRCVRSCYDCAGKLDCPLQSRDHGDKGVSGFGLRSACTSCKSNKLCYS